MSNRVTLLLAAGAMLIGATLTGCGQTSEADARLLVLGPASLANHLDDFNARFEDGGTSFSFAGSTTQVRAVIEGLDADVLITANPEVATPVIEAFGLTAMPFVTNRLAVIAASGNPGDVTSLDDLARDDLFVAACAIEVPCGQATAGLPVAVAADSFEASVRAVLTKVRTGDADVGVVYESDVAVGGAEIEVPFVIADEDNVATTYVVFNLSGTATADDYIEQLLTDGVTMLVDRQVGFDAP